MVDISHGRFVNMLAVIFKEQVKWAPNPAHPRLDALFDANGFTNNTVSLYAVFSGSF